jgi:hypothetical protein
MIILFVQGLVSTTTGNLVLLILRVSPKAARGNYEVGDLVPRPMCCSPFHAIPFCVVLGHSISKHMLFVPFKRWYRTYHWLRLALGSCNIIALCNDCLIFLIMETLDDLEGNHVNLSLMYYNRQDKMTKVLIVTSQ